MVVRLQASSAWNQQQWTRNIESGLHDGPMRFTYRGRAWSRTARQKRIGDKRRRSSAGTRRAAGGVRNQIRIDAFADEDTPIDELVAFEIEVGATVKKVGDGFAFAEVDQGPGQVHGDGAVG